MTISRPDIYALFFPEFLNTLFGASMDSIESGLTQVCFIGLKDTKSSNGNWIDKYYKNKIIIDDWCELKDISNKDLFGSNEYDKNTEKRISLYKAIHESSSTFIYNKKKILSKLKKYNKKTNIFYIENLISKNVDSYYQSYDYLNCFFDLLEDNQYLFFTVWAQNKNYFNFHILPNIIKELEKSDLYINGIFVECDIPYKNIDNRIYKGIKDREYLIDQTNRLERGLELEKINSRFLFIISKNKTKGLLYAEDIKQNITKDKVYETNLIKSYVNNFEKLIKSKTDSYKINDLLYLDRDALREELKNGIAIEDFNHQNIVIAKIKNQINFLQKDFKRFKRLSIKELCFEIKHVDGLDTLEELYNKKNVLFLLANQNYDNLKSYDNTEDYKKLSEIVRNKLRRDFIALVLKPDIIKNEYFKLYLKSHLGQLKIDLIYLSMFPIVNRPSISEISNIKVYLPDLKEQDNLINIFNKLEEVSSSIKRISENAFNFPISSKKDILLIDTIHRNTEYLSDIDRVRSIIQRRKETPDTEYKLTFGYDRTSKQKAKYLEEAAFKEIVSFLNERGGDLLIGVKDKETEVVGIQDEIKELYTDKEKDPEDQFLKHIDDLIVSKLGIDLTNHVIPKLVNFDEDKIVCWINCKPSNRMVSLIEKSSKGNIKKTVYRRSGSSARPITDPDELIEFQKERFT